jgi:hypothetical protein
MKQERGKATEGNEGAKMKRREAKFVHASPRLVPGQIDAGSRPQVTPARPARKGRRSTIARAVEVRKGARTQK